MRFIKNILTDIEEAQNRANLSLLNSLKQIQIHQSLDQQIQNGTSMTPFSNPKLKQILIQKPSKKDQNKRSYRTLVLRNIPNKIKHELSRNNKIEQNPEDQSYYLTRKSKQKTTKSQLQKFQTEINNCSQKYLISCFHRKSKFQTEPSSEHPSCETLQRLNQLKIIYQRKNRLYHKLQKLNVELKKLESKEKQKSLSPILEGNNKRFHKKLISSDIGYPFIKDKQMSMIYGSNSRIIKSNKQDAELVERMNKELNGRKISHYQKNHLNLRSFAYKESKNKEMNHKKGRSQRKSFLTQDHS